MRPSAARAVFFLTEEPVSYYDGINRLDREMPPLEFE